MFHIDVLQTCSSESLAENQNWIEEQFKGLPDCQDLPRIVVLPECFLLFGRDRQQQLHLAKKQTHAKIKQWLSHLSQTYQAYLVAGTLPASAATSRVWNRSFLFAPTGKILGHYDKIHLFDAYFANTNERYLESNTYVAGHNVPVFDLGFVKLGIAICYDLRFPELFQQLRLKGAELIAVPAAFAEHTGRTHWQVLLQARAIETQCLIAASAQSGMHQNQRKTWGHSMIIDSWGNVIDRSKNLGWLSSQIQLSTMHDIRKSMPIAMHRRYEPPQIKSLKDKEKNAS